MAEAFGSIEINGMPRCVSLRVRHETPDGIVIEREASIPVHLLGEDWDGGVALLHKLTAAPDMGRRVDVTQPGDATRQYVDGQG